MKVAVIGAGVTGCLLAHTLSSAGFDVSIFEKSRGCGGRASTKQTAWGQCDLGATIVPAQKSEFIAFMQSLCDKDIASKWPQNIYLSKQNAGFNQTLEKYVGDRQYYVFNHKMNAACRHWIQNANLYTNSLINQVRYFVGKGWQLKSNDIWQPEWFDKIVLTAPWPQSQALIQQSELPLKHSDFSQSWTSCWSVALKLEQLVVDDVDLVYLKNQTIQTLVRDSNKPFRPQVSSLEASKSEIWLVQLANQCSDDLGKLGKEKAISIAINGLCEWFDLPHESISNHYAHYWRYARPSLGQKPIGILSLPEDGIYVGGDWSFGASIESAYEAAQTLSQAMITGE